MHQTLKCGYCGFLLRGSCGNALVHKCFSQFNENEHVLNIDDNYVITMQTRCETKDAEQIDEDEEENADLSSEFLTSNLDEILIDLVHVRRCLWDHTIPIKERTKLKKEALWQEIVNILGSSLTVITAKQKWKQLRYSYVKARKRMQGYVRSGSGAEAAHPQKSSLSHYERMRFLDDTFKAAPTINSLHEFLPSSSRASDEYSNYNAASDISMEFVDNSIDTRSADFTDSDRCSTTSTTHLPSNVSRSNKKKVDKHAQLQETFLKVLNEVPQRERDAVEGFLDQLGDLLRYLPYLRRRNFQKKIMDLAMAEEDEMLAENVQ